MSTSVLTAQSPALAPPHTEHTPERYSLVHVLAMPISFAVVLLLTRLAAG